MEPNKKYLKVSHNKIPNEKLKIKIGEIIEYDPKLMTSF
jgi:hypothetical protein